MENKAAINNIQNIENIQTIGNIQMSVILNLNVLLVPIPTSFSPFSHLSSCTAAFALSICLLVWRHWCIGSLITIHCW